MYFLSHQTEPRVSISKTPRTNPHDRSSVGATGAPTQQLHEWDTKVKIKQTHTHTPHPSAVPSGTNHNHNEKSEKEQEGKKRTRHKHPPTATTSRANHFPTSKDQELRREIRRRRTCGSAERQGAVVGKLEDPRTRWSPGLALEGKTRSSTDNYLHFARSYSILIFVHS